MAGHTPGPWCLTPYWPVAGYGRIADKPAVGKFQAIVEPVPGQEMGCRSQIVSVGIKGREVDDYWLNIKPANAHLIAAAPVMLAALKLVMQHGRIDDSEHRMNTVAAAIAAAEGGA